MSDNNYTSIQIPYKFYPYLLLYLFLCPYFPKHVHLKKTSEPE